MPITALINIDLHRVKEYFDTNKLCLNVPNCEFMIVGTYQSLAKVLDIRIHINNESETSRCIKISEYEHCFKSKMG